MLRSALVLIVTSKHPLVKRQSGNGFSQSNKVSVTERVIGSNPRFNSHLGRRRQLAIARLAIKTDLVITHVIS